MIADEWNELKNSSAAKHRNDGSGKFTTNSSSNDNYDVYHANNQDYPIASMSQREQPVQNTGELVMPMVKEYINDFANGEISKEIRKKMIELVDKQNAKGMKKYGTELRTWNERSALQDLAEELTDALVYAAQFKMRFESSPHSTDRFFVSLIKNMISQIAEILYDVVELQAEFPETEKREVNDD